MSDHETVHSVGVDTRWNQFNLPKINADDPEIRRTLVGVVQYLNLDQIQLDFAAKPAGQAMASMVRFRERFRPQDYPDELWIKYLGSQSNNLLHGDYTHHLGEQVLLFETGTSANHDLLAVQQFLLGFTNLTHDWGESNPEVGDVAFGNHKPNRDKERHIRSALAKEALDQACAVAGLSGETYPHLAVVIDSIVEWSDHVAFTKPDFSALAQGGEISPDEYYQHLYRATKYLGHFSVALRANRLVQERSRRPILETASQLLSIQVTHNALPVLIEYAHIFEGIDVYLQSQIYPIDRIIGKAMRTFKSSTINYNDEYERPLRLNELNMRWWMYKSMHGERG